MLKEITFTKINIIYLIKFLILVTLATFAPLLGFHSQWITGPIVNMALILSAYLLGIRGALLIGILPSTIALSTGLLPAVLAPMVPFIILGNSILILIIDLFLNKSGEDVGFYKKYFLALAIAAAFKFLFLFFTSSLVINLLLKQALADKVARMMSWPQFFTAIIGGILAFGILKVLKARYGES